MTGVSFLMDTKGVGRPIHTSDSIGRAWSVILIAPLVLMVLVLALPAIALNIARGAWQQS